MSQAPPELEKLPEVTTLLGAPVVGQWYRVPALRLLSSGLWVPVLGPPHADPTLPGGREEHYHLDLRFSTLRLLRSWDAFMLFDSDAVVLESGLLFVVSAKGDPPPALKPMQCLREQLVHSAHNIRRLVEATVPPGACLKEGRCPHRRILRNDMREVVEDGVRVLVCPGHGLRFDADTGILRRCSAELAP